MKPPKKGEEISDAFREHLNRLAEQMFSTEAPKFSSASPPPSLLGVIQGFMSSLGDESKILGKILILDCEATREHEAIMLDIGISATSILEFFGSPFAQLIIDEIFEWGNIADPDPANWVRRRHKGQTLVISQRRYEELTKHANPAAPSATPNGVPVIDLNKELADG